jgi:hormone-sensitive lipase
VSPLLKDWTINLDIPILSIDYTLSLEAPYPRAVEEVFYAYCWILLNHDKVGTTGENIIICGDSAGANLAAVCIVKCIEMKIPTPKSFVSFYGVFEVGIFHPSAFCALMDPLLHSSFILKSAMIAYLGKEIQKGEESKREIMIDPHISPCFASDEILKKFPKTCLITTILDSFCDQNVEFGKSLRNLGVKVDVEVLGDLGHGFLYFKLVMI